MGTEGIARPAYGKDSKVIAGQFGEGIIGVLDKTLDMTGFRSVVADLFKRTSLQRPS